MITGKTLMDLGYTPGVWMKQCVNYCNEKGITEESQIVSYAHSLGHSRVVKQLLRAESLAYTKNIDTENAYEEANLQKVETHMQELMRVPTVQAGAIMPDACPSDKRIGYIPVGCVVATKDAIHPGMHSADICCSMAASYFPADTNLAMLLETGMQLSHFGGGGRPRGKQFKPTVDLLANFENNPFLKDLVSPAIEHFATQGDGNHFLYVGRLESTGNVVLVTHHGSRRPGAELYKRGMKLANNFRLEHSPETHEYNAWIPSETADGDEYWDALQLVREWTKQNHFKIHDLIAEFMGIKVDHRFWNEHNFVFRKSDGLFYHAKGSTPVWKNHADDSSGQMIIPLNMAQPVLIVEPHEENNQNSGLQFAPHGAGRNFSRTQYMKDFEHLTVEQMIAQQAPGIVVHYWSGKPDASELPFAYKNADSVIRQIEKYKLAHIVDKVIPYGNVMAGDWSKDAPWRKKKASKEIE